MQTAAGGPLRIKFDPERIARLKYQMIRIPGMNNSGGDRYRKESVQAQQHQEHKTKRKEEEIKSRMEMRPTLKRKATTAEKLQGKKDEYKQVPQVVGMSGADPLLSFYIGGIGLNGVGALTKTGLWNIAKYAPTTQLGNWGRGYFVGNAFKNSFNGNVPKPVINPQTRTRVGDVEVDNPNLLYHLDRGDGAGAFSNQGAYVKNGVLFPGIAKREGQLGYSWWNEGKPYATSVKGQPMTRLMTATKDAPGMLQVRSQNYPIGQWTGSKGFVLPSEYVNSEGVNVSGSLYIWKPGYGYQRIIPEPPTAYFGDPTQNFLKFTGNPKLGKETAANSTFYGSEKNLVEELKNSGVNLSKIPREAVTQALNKRRKLINQTAPSSYTLVEGNPMLHFNYQLYDYRNGKPVGWMNIDRNKEDLNTYVQAVENTNPSYKGTYEKLLNSSIITSQSLRGQGNVSGLQLISAPKQYHVLQKFRNRELTPYKGTHTNAKMVYDKLGIETEDQPAFSMLDLARAGDKETKTLLNAPVWLLKSPTSQVPTKSTVFNPYIIDSNGKMHINWDDILIQHKYGGKIK